MKFMDMLYSRYAYPMDLVNSYINRGRFGEFVTSFLEGENERRKEAAEKDDDLKLWIMYCHCFRYCEESNFGDWKNNLLGIGKNGKRKTKDIDLDDKGIKAIYDGLFPG